LPLMGWWAYGLFDLDEGFYAAIVSEMNRRGEWVTPFYNGRPWFEKPILLYWLGKPLLAVFGENIGPRLPSILATVATYGLVAAFARKHLSERTAQLGVLILGGSLLVVGSGRMMLTDPLLVLCLTAAFLWFWESLDGGGSRYRALTGLALGFGVLAKGPVALILFGLVCGWLYWRNPAVRPGFRGGWAGFWVLLILGVASWYVPAYLANGQRFVQDFLIAQNIGRFLGGDPAHTLEGPVSLLIYVGVLLLGMLPWSLFVPGALLKTARERKVASADDRSVALLGYLATWATVVFLFFTASGAKLPHYILPLCPPLAMLIAHRLKRPWTPAFAMAWCVIVAAVAHFGFLFWYGESGHAELHQATRYIRVHANDEEVAVYQMTRRQADRGTGSTQIQETSQPSVLLYLNRTVTDTDALAEILALPTPAWILTRSNRIGPEEFLEAQLAGKRLEEVHGTLPRRHFRVFRLSAP
jgi:4-amino-4-deoxy-L-arabinose transferase-like glycosyltransferase